MTTVVEQELQEYLLQLNEAEKKSILDLIKTFVQGRSQTPRQISIEEYNKEIDEAEVQFERGEYITHEDMLKQMKQW